MELHPVGVLPRQRGCCYASTGRFRVPLRLGTREDERDRPNPVGGISCDITAGGSGGFTENIARPQLDLRHVEFWCT